VLKNPAAAVVAISSNFSALGLRRICSVQLRCDRSGREQQHGRSERAQFNVVQRSGRKEDWSFFFCLEQRRRAVLSFHLFRIKKDYNGLGERNPAQVQTHS
jgi:hypothetical protein